MRLTGEIMKIITCFKLVPEEQDIVVTPEYTLNFDNADAKISQFDLNAIEADRKSTRLNSSHSV